MSGPLNVPGLLFVVAQDEITPQSVNLAYHQSVGALDASAAEQRPSRGSRGMPTREERLGLTVNRALSSDGEARVLEQRTGASAAEQHAPELPGSVRNIANQITEDPSNAWIKEVWQRPASLRPSPAPSLARALPQATLLASPPLLPAPPSPSPPPPQELHPRQRPRVAARWGQHPEANVSARRGRTGCSCCEQRAHGHG